MYIQPSTNVYLLKGVSIDKDYNHTVRQLSRTLQFLSFQPYIKYSFTNTDGIDNRFTYQRSDKNKIRVGLTCDLLYDCNYMIFQNSNYSDKYFYAFINSVDYLNDNVTEITYTIDVMQTWYFDYVLGDCFVEREHNATNYIGDNLVPEPVSFSGTNITNKKVIALTDPLDDTLPPYYLVACYVPNGTDMTTKPVSVTWPVLEYDVITGYFAPDPDPWPYFQHQKIRGANGSFQTNVYNGFAYFAIPLYTTGDKAEKSLLIANSMIEQLVDIQANIISLLQVPSRLWKNVELQGQTEDIETITETGTFIDAQNTVTTYTPKNKKLYTAPFKRLDISNNEGNTISFQWENFFNSSQGSLPTANLLLKYVSMPTPSVEISPKNYKGISYDYENSVICRNFPTPTWTEDSYTKWVNQYSQNATIAALSGTVQGAISFGANPPLLDKFSTATSVVSTIGSAISQHYANAQARDQIHGNISSSNLPVAENRIGFTLYEYSIRDKDAKIIDDFFNMYGYAQNKLKVPYIKGDTTLLRPNWNYIKTATCVIHGAQTTGLPADAEEQISKIYNNGITFWSSIENVGDYTLNNEPS